MIDPAPPPLPSPTPPLAGHGEDRLVADLLARLPAAANAVDPDDDCAVLPCPGQPDRWRLLKTDVVIEGIHYLPATEPARVGWKALCRVVSDFAAMGGGDPAHALVTVALRPETPLAYAQGLYAGLGRAAATFGVQIVGGETARAPGPGFLSVAVSGSVARTACVRRGGGRAGDALFVTGQLGGSFASGRHLDFVPRLAEARWLTASARGFRVHAMMDLSDGLGADLPRLARAGGGGLGWRLDENRLPLAPGVANAYAARTDGEDYELLFALAPTDAPGLEAAWREQFPELPLTRIGELTAPGEGDAGSIGEGGGYDHFR